MSKSLLNNKPNEHSQVSDIMHELSTVKKYVNFVIDSSYSYDQLRTLSQLKPILQVLYKCNHPGLLFSTLWTCMEFRKTCYDEKSIEGARANAVEIIAIRLLRTYSHYDLVMFLTKSFSLNNNDSGDERQEELSALEVAVIASAKHFLSSLVIRRIVNDIWCGRISFWEDMDVIGVRAKKAAAIYHPSGAFWVGYSRLRVPRYKFAIETFNFVIVLGLYCTVLITKNSVKSTHLTVVEVLLDIWFLSFLHDEIGQIRDSGFTGIYMADFWNIFDIGMLLIFLSWLVLRVVGRHSIYYTELAFDILSLEALFLIPRVFSALSLIPYYGALLTSLRQMIKDFLKFAVLISVLCAGFIFSFVTLARNNVSFHKMIWMLVRIFYGSTYIGFDQMYQINPVFGPPLMLLFVTLTNFLLLTILISILSNKFANTNSVLEFHYSFATSCLEGCQSDHLSHFSPPFNLIQLLIMRPLRIFVSSSETRGRNFKFQLFKATHLPYLWCISLFEWTMFRTRRILSMSPDDRHRIHDDLPAEDGEDLSTMSLLITLREEIGEIKKTLEQLQVTRHPAEIEN